MTRHPDYTNKVHIDENYVVGNIHPLRNSFDGRAKLRAAGRSEFHDCTSRPFVAWDGEGINLRGPDKAQSYCLFGASTGDYIYARDGLQSAQCFRLLLKVAYLHPEVYHIGFATGYDVEMMFAGLPHNIIRALHEGKARHWHGFRLKYISKKWFQVSGTYANKHVSCTLYDVWSFFGCSFLAALQTFLPNMPRDIYNRIEAGKKRRGDFEVQELNTTIVEYWQEEVKVIVDLVTKLRTLLNKADLFPNRWHGPASLANYLNDKHHIKKYMNSNFSEYGKDAAQFSYAAGRVENFMVGRLCGTAYRYDRNSAYPSAMVDLPSLRGQKWRRRFISCTLQSTCDGDILGLQDFGLYRVDYEFPMLYAADVSHRFPMPFFHRTRQANILFPFKTKRWVWGVELRPILAENGYLIDRPAVRVVEALELSDLNSAYSDHPYEWVLDMYLQRLALKAAGQEEQVALKLGLNSLYGKMAQQRGWRDGEPLPKWHQLEWAGFVTAHNRAYITQAAQLAAARGILISIETDAIFTTQPMDDTLTISDQLGEWSKETFDDIICLQSGVYLVLQNGKWKLKYRGFDSDSITIDLILKWLETNSLYFCGETEEYKRRALMGSCTRFIGSKLALARKDGMRTLWRRFVTEPREIVVGLSGKRRHIPDFCRSCQHGNYFGDSCMHDMSLFETDYGDGQDTTKSYAMKLPWRTVKHQAAVWRPDEEIDFDIDGIEPDDTE